MKNVLIVDDDLLLLELNESILQNAGVGEISIILCSEAGQAVELTQRAQVPFDLVLTDYQLTEDGNEGAAISATAKKRSSKTKVILVSGALQGDRRKMIISACRADQYLAKPYTVEALTRALRELLCPEPQPA